MTLIILVLAVSAVAAASLVVSSMSLSRYRNCRVVLEVYGEQTEELEKIVENQKQQIEKINTLNVEATRRIAWLEQKIRQPKAQSEIKAEEKVNEPIISTAKPTITERRHRVITLAERGQNAETIAATLGMLAGEVELILNLNRTA